MKNSQARANRTGASALIMRTSSSDFMIWICQVGEWGWGCVVSVCVCVQMLLSQSHKATAVLCALMLGTSGPCVAIRRAEITPGEMSRQAAKAQQASSLQSRTPLSCRTRAPPVK